MPRLIFTLFLVVFVLCAPADAVRMKMVNGVVRPYTAEEEAQADRDAERHAIEKLAQDEARRVEQAREILNVIYNNQTPGVRAQFYTLRAAVKEALDNDDIEAARLIIEAADVPPGLEQVKTDMLNALPSQ